MAIYHCSVKMIGRAGGRGAIASAAYRSGEKLYDRELGQYFDFTKKHGVVFKEVILCDNAPRELMDREALWSSVQEVESRVNAQLAREVEVALPIELSRDRQIECVRSFICENFISEGMCADWALHDKGTGNPHAHIMLTVRGFDETHEWNMKLKSVYANARDAKGRAVYDPMRPSYDPHEPKDALGHRPSEIYRIPRLNPDGTQRERVRPGKGKEKLWERVNIPVTDWDQHINVEKWREAWAKECNCYLERSHFIDHRSYERQGLDLIPTRHEGYVVREMERNGSVSDIASVNREIRKDNERMLKLKDQVRDMTNELAASVQERLDEYKERYARTGRLKRDRTKYRTPGDDRGPAEHDRGAEAADREPQAEDRNVQIKGREPDKTDIGTHEKDTREVEFPELDEEWER